MKRAPGGHPRDRFITVFGRKPVLQVLEDDGLRVDKVLVDRRARGPEIDAIVARAKARGVSCSHVDGKQVHRLSKNQKQDQGVAADVEAPRMGTVADWLASQGPGRRAVVALAGVHTPGNVGLAIRSAMGAGMHGILMPRRGTAKLTPLVLKASAGHAFRAPILRCERAEDGLKELADASFRLVGLDGAAPRDLFTWRPPKRVVLVMGNETHGLTPEVERLLHDRVSIPMADGVESLNVACATTLVCYELARRR